MGDLNDTSNKSAATPARARDAQSICARELELASLGRGCDHDLNFPGLRPPFDKSLAEPYVGAQYSPRG